MANLSTICGNEGRLRQYWTAGLEPRFNRSYAALGVENVLDTGFRVHREHQFRVQANGDTPGAREPGTGRNAGIREDGDRNVTAYSAFVQNRVDLGRWTVTPACALSTWTTSASTTCSTRAARRPWTSGSRASAPRSSPRAVPPCSPACTAASPLRASPTSSPPAAAP